MRARHWVLKVLLGRKGAKQIELCAGRRQVPARVFKLRTVRKGVRDARNVEYMRTQIGAKRSRTRRNLEQLITTVSSGDMNPNRMHIHT